MADFDDDDLGKDIAAAFEAAEAPAPVADSTVPTGDAAVTPPEAEKPVDGRSRDETGKFVKSEKPVADDKQKLPLAETVTAGTQQAQPQKPAQTTAPTIAPPQNWKGNGKVEWSRLPQHIQKEISDDYTRLTETQGRLAKLDAAIGDRSQVLAAQYGSVEQGIQNLFAISDMATKNPQGFLLWFAQQRGVNLAALTGQEPQQGQQQQPADGSHPLMQEIAALKSQLQGFVQQQTNSQRSQLQSEIDRFASDPAYPYFNDVRSEMGKLMEAGTAKTLADAYRLAIRLKDDLYENALAAERKKAIAENAALVTQKKQAAVSITGHPGAKAPDDEPDEDLEATVRRSVNRAFAA